MVRSGAGEEGGSVFPRAGGGEAALEGAEGHKQGRVCRAGAHKSKSIH